MSEGRAVFKKKNHKILKAGDEKDWYAVGKKTKNKKTVMIMQRFIYQSRNIEIRTKGKKTVKKESIYNSAS